LALTNMLKGKKAAVLGFGMEGKDLTNYLLGQGAKVFVFDKKEKRELDFEGVAKDKLTVVCGRGYLRNGLGGFDYIFRSPGVYRYLPEILEAEGRGVKISSAINLFFEKCPAKIIGVTGTKGKGTTSTLIYEILKEAGKDVYLAGNIGKAYLELLPRLKKESLVVLELSSFQLIDMEVSPHIAVVLNITQDHLDWHKDLNEYINSKKNIVRFQNANDFTVVNSDYETPKSFAKEARGKVIFFSKTLAKKYKGKLLLRGEHNLENAAGAIAVSNILKIRKEFVAKILSTFKGLEHRLELVGEIGGVKFYNDSFATGPQSTIAAINSFSEPLTIILGGYDKGLDYRELIDVITNKKNVENIILIGNLAQNFGYKLSEGKYKGDISNMGKESMSKIVDKGFSSTPKGGVVLLSPAAASFDMFHDYKERGKKFKEAVKLLLHGEQ